MKAELHGPERCAVRALTVALALASGAVSAQNGGYSSWNLQGLHGAGFQEPGNPRDVGKAIVTVENSAGWSWGSSFFFVDLIHSTANDAGATELYAEWFPSLSLGKTTGNDLAIGPIKDVSLTMGLNAGRKNTGANPLVYLPGVTLDLSLPGFAFASIAAFAYIDRGEINNGQSNGCHATGFQVTPAWLLPISIGTADFQFGGFVDYISSHGNCAAQVLSQPQLTIDAGAAFGGKPGKFHAGVEYQYWNNKFGIEGLDEHFPQLLVMYKF
jgi:nucleoside-specific outer membrane channel protein Tsx